MVQPEQSARVAARMMRCDHVHSLTAPIVQLQRKWTAASAFKAALIASLALPGQVGKSTTTTTTSQRTQNVKARSQERMIAHRSVRRKSVVLCCWQNARSLQIAAISSEWP